MKIVSYNINGVRASVKAGLIDFIKNTDADIYCIQEVRANENVARDLLENSNVQLDMFSMESSSSPLGEYNFTFNCGEVPGYAGTMTISKQKPDKVFYDMGEFWKDNEGRTLTTVFGKTAVVNSYVPNGNSRLEFKMQYLDALTRYLKNLMQSYDVICTGDFNIAHNEIDLTNPKECRNKSVFLPVERETMSKLLNIGLTDTFRFLNPEKVCYSWRSYRSVYDHSYNSWKYRIDYILASKGLVKSLKSSEILEASCSDHLPCLAEFEN